MSGKQQKRVNDGAKILPLCQIKKAWSHAVQAAVSAVLALSHHSFAAREVHCLTAAVNVKKQSLDSR